MLTQDQQNLVAILNGEIQYPTNEQLISALSAASQIEPFLFAIKQFRLVDIVFMYNTKNWYEAAFCRELNFPKFDWSTANIAEIKSSPFVKVISSGYNPDCFSDCSISEMQIALSQIQNYHEFFNNLKGYEIFIAYLATMATAIESVLTFRKN